MNPRPWKAKGFDSPSDHILLAQSGVRLSCGESQLDVVSSAAAVPIAVCKAFRFRYPPLRARIAAVRQAVSARHETLSGVSGSPKFRFGGRAIS